ncbi:alpha-N-acetylgalactosamine-specific lectin-like [Lytechinus pictus]|uniref:alpha-N-acetylgalactosamine-specific lectin-like n=1 Tax=Lytechinus pictus TaxID=7653 RepID=UPI00240CEC7F|nr:alpha-N-acetylgalactosamine-specific lectin-like [Lytechinus pictus]
MDSFKKVFLILTLTTFFMWVSEGGDCRKCPEYWTEMEGYCYQYFGGRQTFDDANTICQRTGAHLVSIRDQTENELIYHLWKGLVKHPTEKDSAYWIGLRDTHQESDFQWTDNTPYTYFNWGPGQPDNAGGEDCVEVRNDGGNDAERMRWNDLPCHHIRAFFCRMPLP